MKVSIGNSSLMMMLISAVSLSSGIEAKPSSSVSKDSYFVNYTCNGQTYSPETPYEVVTGKFELQKSARPDIFMPAGLLSGSVGPNDRIQMPTSRNFLSLQVDVTLNSKNAVAISRTNIGILAENESSFAALAGVNDHGVKQLGESYTLTSGSPFGWVGCVLSVTKD